MNELSWKDFVFERIENYCSYKQSQLFTLKEFISFNREAIQAFSKDNNHPEDKVRQILQFLRNDGKILFLGEHGGKKGTYLLGDKEQIYTTEINQNNVSEVAQKFIYSNYYDDEINEYNQETRKLFVRDTSLIGQAQDNLGRICLHPHCNNHFTKADGEAYIEVHHIIPLHKNGKDALWNLIVVCAHHHKMAHFADMDTQYRLQETFLEIVAEHYGY